MMDAVSDLSPQFLQIFVLQPSAQSCVLCISMFFSWYLYTYTYYSSQVIDSDNDVLVSIFLCGGLRWHNG
jgi:hypothetical protein